MDHIVTSRNGNVIIQTGNLPTQSFIVKIEPDDSSIGSGFWWGIFIGVIIGISMAKTK